jgi:hypothetical protein
VPHDDSFGRRAREYTTTVLTVALPIAEAVPVVGSPIKAAIGGLLVVLNIVDVSARDCHVSVSLDEHRHILQQVGQNKEDIAKLEAKLRSLDSQISAIPTAQSSSATAHRDELTKCGYSWLVFRLT